MTGSISLRLLLAATVIGALVASGAPKAAAKPPLKQPVANAKPKVKKPAPAVNTNEALGPVVYVEDLNGLKIDWTRGTLTVSGVGVGGDRGARSYRQQFAGRAASADAYRRFALALALVHVDASTRMQDLAVSDEGLRTRLNAFVKQAKVLETNFWPDGSAELVLGADLRGPKGLAHLLASAKTDPNAPDEAPEAAPSSEATPSAVPSAEGGGKEIVTAPVPIHDHFSALILDGHGSGLKPALFPTVRDATGKAIDLEGNGGHLAVSYLKGGADLEPRAGLNPLKLKATRTQGPLHGDLVLDIANANALKKALAAGKLPVNSPVLVVL